MTQLLTEHLLYRFKVVLTVLTATAALTTVLLAVMVLGVMPRLQERQDDLAAQQADSAEAAIAAAEASELAAEASELARAAAESTDKLLRDTIAGLRVPNPQTVYTRDQLTALCEQLLGSGCPDPPPTTTTSTTSGSQ